MRPQHYNVTIMSLHACFSNVASFILLFVDLFGSSTARKVRLLLPYLGAVGGVNKFVCRRSRQFAALDSRVRAHIQKNENPTRTRFEKHEGWKDMRFFCT